MPTIRNSILTAVIAFGGGVNAAYGQSDIELTVVHGSPSTHITATHGVEPWMNCVREKLPDSISFRYFPGGQLAQNNELLQSLNTGVADLAPIPMGYASDKMPLNTVAMLPGLGSGAEQMVNAYAKSITTGPLAGEFKANDVVPIWAKVDDPYQLASRNGAVHSPEDFNGKVIRSSGGPLNLTVEALGASTAEIPIGDTYIGLERGTVDGAFAFYSSISAYNLNEVVDAISTNGSFGSFSHVFSMRADRWRELPDEAKETFLVCGKKVQGELARFIDKQKVVFEEKFKRQGVELYPFTPEELSVLDEKFKAVQQKWVSRLSRRGLPSEEVLKTYKNFLNDK